MTFDLRKQTAYHEAGHAVVSYRLGFITSNTTIVPDEQKGTAGTQLGEQSPEGDDPTEYIVVLYAGFQAERKCNPNADSRGSCDDDQRAADLLSGWPHLSEAELRQRASQLVSEHWSEIESVAVALLEYGTLVDDEATLVCDAVREGLDWRNELDTYRQIRQARVSGSERSSE